MKGEVTLPTASTNSAMRSLANSEEALNSKIVPKILPINSCEEALQRVSQRVEAMKRPDNDEQRADVDSHDVLTQDSSSLSAVREEPQGIIETQSIFDVKETNFRQFSANKQDDAPDRELTAEKRVCAQTPLQEEELKSSTKQAYSSKSTARSLLGEMQKILSVCTPFEGTSDRFFAPPGVKRYDSSSSSNDFPPSFRIQDKWGFVDEMEPNLTLLKSEQDLAVSMANRCINTRGAIAHGKKPGLENNIKDFISPSNVESLFNDFCEGAKRLESINSIKKELMTHGPVVSASFHLSKIFLENDDYSTSFLKILIGKKHPLLLTGWRLTQNGEMWIVQGLNQHSEHNVAFGHFGIDNVCIAPKDCFDNLRWQPGPYFDFDFSKVIDFQGSSIIKSSMNDADLKKLAACFDTGFGKAISNKSTLELCDKTKRAFSCTSFLKEVALDKATNQWQVTFAMI